jgi:precorrin-2 dehydrogenase / sirohydrochlorin ferrochelatase
MLPIVIDPAAVRVGVAGQGDGLHRRLKVLSDAGLAEPIVFDGVLPAESDLLGLRILFVAGWGRERSHAIAAVARTAGLLINVEDQPELCDFHVPAAVRRGDLLLTVSTGGQSPGLARLLREKLERLFGPEWRGRVEAIAQERAEWRAAGLDPGSVSARTRDLINARGWLR